MWKKIAIILAIAVINVLATFALCINSIQLNDPFSFPNTSKIIEDAQDSADVNPGAGEYALIVGGLSFVLEGFAVIALILLIGLIPNILTTITAILALAALLFQIGEEKKWKLVTGAVLLTIATVLEFFESILLVFIIAFNYIMIGITLVLNIAFAIFILINTIQLYKKISSINANSNVVTYNN